MLLLNSDNLDLEESAATRAHPFKSIRLRGRYGKSSGPQISFSLLQFAKAWEPSSFFEDFQFSILRLLIIRAGRTQVVGFAGEPVARGPGRRFRERRGIEGPFVNSPNAWLRLGWLVARPPRRAFFMILLD